MPDLIESHVWRSIIESADGSAEVIETLIEGPAGADGDPGPNIVSDSTAVGTLTSAAADAASVLSTNSTGNAVRRIPLTSYSRSLLGLADASAGRSALGLGSASLLDASNVALLNAANTFTAGPQVFVGGATIRATGGTPGTDDVEISHTGDDALIRSRSGLMQIQAVGSIELLNNWGAVMQRGGGTSGWFDSFGYRLYSGVPGSGTERIQIFSPAAGLMRLNRPDTNGQSASLSLAGPSSLGTVRDVAVLTSSFSTAADASFQGQLSIGVRGIVGATVTLQTGLTVTAQASGTPSIRVFGPINLNQFDVLDGLSPGSLNWTTPFAGTVNFTQGQSGQGMAFRLITAEGKIAGFTHYDVANAAGRLFQIQSQPGVAMSFSPQESEMIRMTGSTIGFFGVTPVAKPTFVADATDLATALTLVNDLKARLVAYGLGA
jgi:hypothetical protein